MRHRFIEIARYVTSSSSTPAIVNTAHVVLIEQSDKLKGQRLITLANGQAIPVSNTLEELRGLIGPIAQPLTERERTIVGMTS